MTATPDLDMVRQELEATLLVDTIRVTRPTGLPVLDEETGVLGPVPADLVYEGPGALLSGHGQITAQQVVGTEWLDDTVSWYRLLIPLAAPTPQRYDRVEVTEASSVNAATLGRVWQVLDPSEASTVEVLRVTRLDEITPP